jgi:pyruvate dehydrogenase E2 component (dihydrolipoamide acetyltransferase)
MPIELKMPALSPTMEEGTLAKWLKQEGDKVTSGDVIAEIETDKATMEYEAIDEGVIAKILVAEGTDEVKVGTVIAILIEEGEELPAAGAAPAPAPPRLLPEAAKPAPASRPHPRPPPNPKSAATAPTPPEGPADRRSFFLSSSSCWRGRGWLFFFRARRPRQSLPARPPPG